MGKLLTHFSLIDDADLTGLASKFFQIKEDIFWLKFPQRLSFSLFVFVLFNLFLFDVNVNVEVRGAKPKSENCCQKCTHEPTK